MARCLLSGYGLKLGYDCARPSGTRMGREREEKGGDWAGAREGKEGALGHRVWRPTRGKRRPRGRAGLREGGAREACLRA